MKKQEVLKRCCRVIPFEISNHQCITPCPYGVEHKIISGVLLVGSHGCADCMHNVETNHSVGIVYCKNPEEHKDDK